jgi:DNA-binding transcriptional LysR family regulator
VELRELRTFVAVVEEGRFAGAAQRLNLSQPAVSHTIRGLEKSCGVQLFDRTSAGVVTTAAGKLLLVEAREVLARHEQAVAVMSRTGDREQPLRVGIPSGLPAGMLSTALATVVVEFPTTPVDVRHSCTAGQIAMLSAGELDLGLLRSRPPHNDLDATLVADEPLGVIVSASQAERLTPIGGEIGLETLIGLEWHGFHRDSSPAWYDELTATLRSHGFQVDTVASSNEQLVPEVVHATVSLGRSFALAPSSCCRTLPPPLTWRRLAGDPLRRRTWAAWAAVSRRRDLGRLVALLEGDQQDDARIACVG